MMVEFRDACGREVSINPIHVEYVQESNIMNNHCTLICFNSGEKIFVCNSYEYVVKTIERSK